MSKETYYGHPRFQEIVDRLKSLHSEKNRQYATAQRPLGNFERVGAMYSPLFNEHIRSHHLEPLAVALILEGKQVDGLIQLVAYLKQDTPDSIDEKCSDKAVYSILQMILAETLTGNAGRGLQPERPEGAR